MKFWKPKQVLHSKHRSVWPRPISRPGGHMIFTARTLDKGSTPFPHHCTPLGSSRPEPLLFLLPCARAPLSTQANGQVSLNRCSRLGLSRPPAYEWKLRSPSHAGCGAPSEERCRETSRPSFSSCSLRNNDKLTGCGKSSTRSPFPQLHAASAPDSEPPTPGPALHARGRSPSSTQPVPRTVSPLPRVQPFTQGYRGCGPPPHLYQRLQTAGPGRRHGRSWPSPVHPPALPGLLCPPGSPTSVCPGSPASRVSPVSLPPPGPIPEGDRRTHGLPALISVAPRPRLCRTPAQPTSASGGAEGTTLLCTYVSRRAHVRCTTTRCPQTSPRGLQGWNEGGPALVCVLLLCTCSRNSPREKNLIPNPTPVPVATLQHGFWREPRCSPVRRRG